MQRTVMLFLVFLLSGKTIVTHAQGYYDSLEAARNLMEHQKFNEALSILSSFEKMYPNDVHVLRLHGQALYWSKDFQATQNYFEAEIIRNPDLKVLKLDYGRILFELNQLKKAEVYLTEYLQVDPENAEVQILLGKIAYWQGARPKKSLQHYYTAQHHSPTNHEIIEGILEVRQNTSPYLKISSSRYSDSQPLESLLTTVETGFYQSTWFQPSFQFQNRAFGNDLNAQHLQFSNKTAVLKSKTTVSMRVGVFKNNWENQPAYTAGVDVKQILPRNYELSGGIDRTPYLYTLASLSSNVMQTNYITSIGRETGNKLKSKVIYQQQQFDDSNYVQWFSLWGLYPIVSSQVIQFDMGYAFLFANSKENRFVLENQVDDALTPIVPGNRYPGVFDPYFTPQNQLIHSLLAKLDLKLGSKVSLTFNNNIGVYATIDNPNFVVVGSETSVGEPADQLGPSMPLGGGVPPGVGNPGGPGLPRPGNPTIPTEPSQPEDVFELYKVFSPIRFFPLDLKNTLNWKVSEKIMFSAEYNYFKTIWFDSHTFTVGLKMNIWNEKRP